MSSFLLPLLLLGTALAVLGVKFHRHQPPAHTVNAPLRPLDVPAESPASSPPATPSQQPALSKPGYGTPWDALNQEDFQGFVRALRAGGCPENTVRDIAVAALGRRHQQRVETPLRLRNQQSTWWKDAWSSQEERLSVAMQREREALDRELLDLLGVSGAELRETIGWKTASPASDWLDPAKRTQLTQWQQRHAAELKELESRALPGAPGPLITEELRVQLKNLRLQHREELGVLLGAEDFEQYLVRETDEASYVLHHLPQAQSEEEFRLWVQAAIDVGVEQADIQAERLSALLPTSASNSKAPSLRDRVLNRFRELNDSAERFQLLEAEMAAEQKRKQEEQTRQREREQLEELQQIATLAGTSITLEEARQFTEALERHAKVLEQRWGPPPTRENEAERTAWETQIKAEFEKIAVSVLGDRGRAITQEMIRQETRSP